MGVYEVYYNFIGLFTCFMFLLFVSMQVVLTIKERRLIISALAVNIILLVARSIDFLINCKDLVALSTLRNFTSFVGYALTPAIAYILMLTRLRKNKWYYSIPLVINIILSFISMFCPLIYRIENNIYSSGYLYYLPTIIAILYLLGFIGIVLFRPTHDKMSRISLLAVAIVIMLCGIFEYVGENNFICWNLSSIGLAFYYTISVMNHNRLDPLTQLYNRKYFNDKFYLIQKKDHTIALLDIDSFKEINDKMGHIYGDYVLQQFGLVFSKSLDQNSEMYRFGGDEFLIVSSLTEEELTNKIKSIMSDSSLPFVISYGIARYSRYRF